MRCGAVIAGILGQHMEVFWNLKSKEGGGSIRQPKTLGEGIKGGHDGC
jgi:hypothetical protein